MFTISQTRVNEFYNFLLKCIFSTGVSKKKSRREKRIQYTFMRNPSARNKLCLLCVKSILGLAHMLSLRIAIENRRLRCLRILFAKKRERASRSWSRGNEKKNTSFSPARARIYVSFSIVSLAGAATLSRLLTRTRAFFLSQFAKKQNNRQKNERVKKQKYKIERAALPCIMILVSAVAVSSKTHTHVSLLYIYAKTSARL